MRTCIVTIAICLLFSAMTSKAASPSVSIASDEQTFTLSNGILSAVVDKRSGRLDSLKYNGIETLVNAYWSHSAASPATTATITIDPKTNGGERGEVAIKSVSNGKAMGAGPRGGAIADIENT